MLESLADLPWPPVLLAFALQIAAGHVEADAIAPDASERLIERNIAAALAERDHQFDLVMHVVRFIGVGEITAIDDEAARILLEEERLFAIGIAAHLDRMRRIVAPDAIDAVNRKHGLGSA